MSSAQDQVVAARARLLFASLMVEYEIYRGCNEAETDFMREQVVQRLRGLHPSEKETVIVFMLDILSKIGPTKLANFLEEYEAQKAAETE